MSSIRNFALLALASAVTACASGPTFTSTWVNPEAAPAAFAGKKVLAVVPLAEPGRRRSAEDALAQEITKRGAIGVPAYTLFPSFTGGVDTAAARVTANKAGIAGLIIMQFMGREQSISSTPTYTSASMMGSPYYRSAWGHYGYGMTAYSGESIQTDVTVMVETRVHSLEQGRMLWAGSSETLNPTKSDDIIRDLAKAITIKMQDAKLFLKPAK